MNASITHIPVAKAPSSAVSSLNRELASVPSAIKPGLDSLEKKNQHSLKTHSPTKAHPVGIKDQSMHLMDWVESFAWPDAGAIKLAIVSFFKKLKDFFAPIIEKLKTRSFLKKLYKGDASLTQPMIDFLETFMLFSPLKDSSLQKLDPALRKGIGNTRFFNVPELNGIELASWHLPAKKGKPTVLLNYGRYSNMGYYGALFKTLQKEGYGFFSYDYPGFGKSDGRSSITTVHHAAMAAQKELMSRGVPSSEHILTGFSLGGAVATNHLHRLLSNPDFEKYRPKALLLLNTLSQPSDVIRSQAKEYKLYSNWLYKHTPDVFIRFPEFNDFFELDTKIADIARKGIPTLVIHSDKDRLFPSIQGKRLYDAARQVAPSDLPIRFQIVKGHHDINKKFCAQVPPVLNGFMEQLDKRKVPLHSNN